MTEHREHHRWNAFWILTSFFNIFLNLNLINSSIHVSTFSFAWIKYINPYIPLSFLCPTMKRLSFAVRFPIVEEGWKASLSHHCSGFSFQKGTGYGWMTFVLLTPVPLWHWDVLCYPLSSLTTHGIFSQQAEIFFLQWQTVLGFLCL